MGLGTDDLSYRKFTFTIDVDADCGLGSYSELVSPAIEGIGEGEWSSMTHEDRLEWLRRASAEWAAEAVEVSWS